MVEGNKAKDPGKKLWKYPWGYRESYILAGLLLLTGFLVQSLLGKGVVMPAWPLNLAVIIVFVLYYILVHFFIKHPTLTWLSGVQSAIASISAFTLMVLLLGFIPQGADEGNLRFIDTIGLTSVTNSWAYLMSALYLLIVLGFTVMKRISSVVTLKNLAFILNHAGLWLVVVSASLGSADLWRLSMKLETGRTVTRAVNTRGEAYELGFGMMLKDFSIEEYPPELVLINRHDYSMKMAAGGRLAIVEEGTTARLENYSLSFERYLPYARSLEGGKYDTAHITGAARAVYVTARDLDTEDFFEGWISDGSFIFGAKILHVNDGQAIAMTTLSPKKFSSDIRLFHSMEDYEDFHIEVNKPFSIDGWKIYQTGYDEQMGRWSESSIIEMVRDPWLPVVYTSIFMILLGTSYLLWMGKGRTKPERT